MKRKSIIFTGIILFLTVSVVVVSCKKDEKIAEETQTKQKQKNKDSLQQDSIKKANARIEFSRFIFPKKNKDSAMSVFLEKYSQEERDIILAINRLDDKNKWRADTLVIPQKIDDNFLKYSPFPQEISVLKPVDKMAFFSYAIHAYGLYEKGRLIKWGPSSMGKKETPTKKGLTFTNWKKEIAISTSNSEWKLRWNFNVYNHLGIGWHQYDLPGFHASHSCMRLLEEDAKWMYSWADQWVLIDQGRTILAKGTPVVIFGETDFKSRPWMKLLGNPAANDLSENEMNMLINPYLDEILKEQKNSQEVRNSKNKETESF